MNDTIKLVFLGDFCPINRARIALKSPLKPITGNITDELEGKDLVIANLECPLTAADKPIKKIGPNLKVLPEAVSLLQAYHINVVTLANNHIMDYGYDGLEETLNALEKKQIDHVGAGLDKQQIASPLVLEIKGKKIGLINVSEEEFNINVERGAGANHFNLISLIENIAACKSKADYIFIIYHGGVEYYPYPTPVLQERMRFLTSLGVSAIFCHHSHTIVGYETWNSVPIFYGLGNFLFDWPDKSENWHIGLKVEMMIHGSGLSFTCNFFRQYKDKLGVDTLEGMELDRVNQEFRDLSEKIVDHDMVINKWKEYAREAEPFILSELFSLNKWHRRLIARGLFPNIGNTTYKRNQLFNRFYCESHRELLYQILKEEN